MSVADAAEARSLAEAAADQLGDYIIPRLRAADAPLLTVVAGSTGAGKSALVNALVGHVVSRAGVLRPTTRQPVLVHHPGDERWFADDRILPQLPRVRGALGGADAAGRRGRLRCTWSPDAEVPAGLALLDSPDIDSVSGANRELAATLMAAADLWLFLTTAPVTPTQCRGEPSVRLRRETPRWRSCSTGSPRRLLPRSAAICADLLSQEGLGRRPAVRHRRSARCATGCSTRRHRRELRAWLDGLAGDAGARAAVARRTLTGALSALVVDVVRVADAADRQVAAQPNGLREMAEASFAAGAARVAELGADGSLLRGEVLARWQEFVGAGALTGTLENRMGRLRDAIARAFRGEPAQPEPVVHALESGVARVLLDELGQRPRARLTPCGATTRSVDLWRSSVTSRCPRKQPPPRPRRWFATGRGTSWRWCAARAGSAAGRHAPSPTP